MGFVSVRKKIKTALSLSRKDFLLVLLEKARHILALGKNQLRALKRIIIEWIQALMIAFPQWKHVSSKSYQRFNPFFTRAQLSLISQLVTTEEKTALIGYADKVCNHVFDLLGSGPVALGDPINWQQDFISGRVWPYVLRRNSFIIDLGDDSDIKVPWELSRHQFFVALGQAHLYTGDDKYVLQFKELVQDWIDTNAYKIGVNWLCSMDIGFRAISWLWGRTFFNDSALLDKAFWKKFHSALATHGEYIFNNIEDWGGIKNNHFVSNGTALYLLGSTLPDLPHASAWRAKGKEILEECMAEQVLDDGVDYEMSTAYHRLVLELLLIPALYGQKLGDTFSSAYLAKLEKMIEFVAGFTKPSGEIALFGDNDNARCQIMSEYSRVHINDHRYLLCTGAVMFNRKDFAGASTRFFDETLWLLGPQSAEAFGQLYTPLKPTSQAFKQGGFYHLANTHFWALVDCGPRGIPGAVGVHGHNDATSFELAIHEESVIVDSGMYAYSRYPAINNEMKSTNAHNLLVVDNLQISDTPDSLWVIGEDVQAKALEFEANDVSAKLEVTHSGYMRLEDPVQVHRVFALNEQSFEITDSIRAARNHDVEIRFHTPLHAHVENGVVLLQGKQACFKVAQSDGSMECFCEPCKLAESYGVYRPQGFVFGWRRSDADASWSATTTFSITGTHE